MKILKGSFDNTGKAIGWTIETGGRTGTDSSVPHALGIGEIKDPKDAILYLPEDGRVFVRGVEIVEWTKERKIMMGIPIGNGIHDDTKAIQNFNNNDYASKEILKENL